MYLFHTNPYHSISLDSSFASSHFERLAIACPTRSLAHKPNGIIADTKIWCEICWVSIYIFDMGNTSAILWRTLILEDNRYNSLPPFHRFSSQFRGLYPRHRTARPKLAQIWTIGLLEPGERSYAYALGWTSLLLAPITQPSTVLF